MQDSLIDIVPYSPEYKEIWNEFVEKSKNGTFLFNRNYMDYHADRFQDASLLIFRKGKLYALLPANRKQDIIFSHQGLTYGGLIMSPKCTAQGVLDAFFKIKDYFKSQGIKNWIYKPVPYIYTSLPSEEDLYALFRHDATLVARSVSSTIPLQNQLKFSRDRKESLRHALKSGVRVMETSDLSSFWKILEDNLSRKFGVKPVHTLSEMQLLQSRFPENIRLFAAFKDREMMGGVLCYFCGLVIHSQYISASEEGKKCGAIDAVVKHLLDSFASGCEWFDFGISNENGGRYLNENLIWQKEGFGGRAVCYDTYEMEL